jgi:hypothetical protein
MKRIRRVSIEVERREIALYASSSSSQSLDDGSSPAAEPALVSPGAGTPSEELATALKEERVHLHRSAEGRLIVCNRANCEESLL